MRKLDKYLTNVLNNLFDFTIEFLHMIKNMTNEDKISNRFLILKKWFNEKLG